MTDTKDEEAAERWADKLWRQDGKLWESDKPHKVNGKLAFLAGCKHVRAEQKELMAWVENMREYLKAVPKDDMNYDAEMHKLKKLEQILPEEK